jgi:hypothetical protein
VSKAEVDVKLVQVKLALARKCENLAKSVHSKPRRASMLRQAAKFRRQAADLARR